MPFWYIWLAVLLAAYRVTRLITRDSILDIPRAWVVERLHPGGYLDELVHCVWCVGFWVSVVAVILVWTWPVGTALIASPFAFSAVIGHLNRIDD